MHVYEGKYTKKIYHAESNYTSCTKKSACCGSRIGPATCGSKHITLLTVTTGQITRSDLEETKFLIEFLSQFIQIGSGL